MFISPSFTRMVQASW